MWRIFTPIPFALFFIWVLCSNANGASFWVGLGIVVLLTIGVAWITGYRFDKRIIKKDITYVLARCHLAKK